MKDLHVNPKHLTESAYNDSNKIDLRNEIQETFSNHPVPWFEWVFDQLDLPARAQILEVGCGSGAFWQKNQTRIPKGWKVTLSDLSSQMVQTAQSNLRAMRRNFYCTCFDSQSLPFPDKNFDAVLAIGLLDYVPDINRALSEVSRVLRPSGQFLATAGSQQHLDEMQSLLNSFLPEEQARVIGGEEARFGLENGEAQLRSVFPTVTRHDYRTTMTFHQSQPILDYVFSETEIISSMNLDQLSAFVHKVKRRLADQGAFDVTIEKGVFVAKKL